MQKLIENIKEGLIILSSICAVVIIFFVTGVLISVMIARGELIVSKYRHETKSYQLQAKEE